MANWTSIIIIGAVILVAVFFVLPMLGTSTSGKGGGIGGGAETIPSGDIGQGGILPSESATGGTSIYYVPGTGTNDSVTPSMSGYDSAIPGNVLQTVAGSGGKLQITGQPTGLYNITEYGKQSVEQGLGMHTVDTYQAGGLIFAKPSAGQPAGTTIHAIAEVGAGSGKSTTQNIAVSNPRYTEAAAATKGSSYYGSVAQQAAASMGAKVSSTGVNIGGGSTRTYSLKK